MPELVSGEAEGRSGGLLEWHTSLSVGGVGALNLWDSFADDGLGNDDSGLAVIQCLGLGDGSIDGSKVVT